MRDRAAVHLGQDLIADRHHAPFNKGELTSSTTPSTRRSTTLRLADDVSTGGDRRHRWQSMKARRSACRCPPTHCRRSSPMGTAKNVAIFTIGIGASVNATASVRWPAAPAACSTRQVLRRTWRPSTSNCLRCCTTNQYVLTFNQLTTGSAASRDIVIGANLIACTSGSATREITVVSLKFVPM